MQYFPLDIGFAKSCCLRSSAGNQSLLYFGGGGKSAGSLQLRFLSGSLVSPLCSYNLVFCHVWLVFIVHLRKDFIFHWCIDPKALRNSDKSTTEVNSIIAKCFTTSQYLIF